MGPILLPIVASCSTDPAVAQPGTPVLQMGSEWIRGAAFKGYLAWPSARPCNVVDATEDCADGTVTVTAMSCQGCSVVFDWSGMTVPSFEVLTVFAKATQDGPVSLDVTMQFKPTGATQTVSISATVDHEVALVAQCRVIDKATFMQLPSATIADDVLRDCGSPPQKDDHVVVVPSITTAHGEPRFPFCFQPFACDGPMGEQFRDVKTLTISTPPIQWALDATVKPGELAVLPLLDDATPISISTQLATGETVSASITPPQPVQ